MTGSKRLRGASRFLPDGRLKTAYQLALDSVNPYDRATDLPKGPTADRLAEVSKVDRSTGRPETP